MMTRNINRLLVLLLLFPLSLHAQDEMTVEKAIKLGLKNNYNIQIARNTARISANNKGKGTAGFLPTLDASGNYLLGSTDEESNSPSSSGDTDIENWGAQVSLNWTLFDGFKMFIDQKKFNELAKLGEYQARERIENTVLAISRAFFNLVQQEQLLDVARNSREISETRLYKEQVRKELGGASSTDFLNAQVAFNSDQSRLLNQELQVTIAREELNLLLGQDPATSLVVSKEITIPVLAMELDDILTIAAERNASLMIARQGKTIADRNIQLARSPFLPRLSLNAGYGYSDYTVSSSLMNDISTQSTDVSIGLMLSFNLFNGRRNGIELQNAKIEARNQELALQDAHNQLAGLVRQTHETFQKRTELLRLEEQNIIAAQQNLQLQKDRYQIGAGSSLEFRDAQVSLIRAQTALIAARYLARITRLEITRLTGNLEIE